MRTRGLFLFLLLSLASAGAASAAEWTVLIYMAADNNLERAALSDVREMEQVGSTDKVNVVVMFDRGGKTGPTESRWKGCRVARIVKADGADMASFAPGRYEDWGDVNTGDPAVLTKFLTMGSQRWPAAKTMLVIWNHGTGWRELSRAIASDDTSGDILTNLELRQAIQQSNVPLEVLGMDACLMGMIEVAWETHGLAKVLIASEELEPDSGWDYSAILETMSTREGRMAGHDLASVVVNSYGRTMRSENPATLSAVDLGAITDLREHVDRYVNALLSNPELRTRWRSAVPAIKSYPIDPDIPPVGNRDLFRVLDLTHELPEAVALQRALGEHVIASFSTEPAGARGLAVFLPTAEEAQKMGGSDLYDPQKYTAANVSFVRDTAWRRLVDFMLTGQVTEGFSPQLARIPITEIAPGAAGVFDVRWQANADAAAASILVYGADGNLTDASGTVVVGGPEPHASVRIGGDFQPEVGSSYRFLVFVSTAKDGALQGRGSRFFDVRFGQNGPMVPVAVRDDSGSDPAPPEDSREVLQVSELAAICGACLGGDDLQLKVNKNPAVYATGENLKIGLKSVRGGYAYFYSLGQSGRLVRLYPDAGATVKIDPAGVAFVPPAGAGDITIAGPVGQELLIAVVVDKPLQSGVAIPASARVAALRITTKKGE